MEKENRAALGKRAGIVGIICNICLAVGKIITGRLCASMAITADGINNLTDGVSAAVIFLGFAVSQRPADKKHPYGHARFEYLTSLVVSMLVLVIGFELVITSVKKIIAPVAVEATLASAIVLAASVAVKLGLMFYYRYIGKRISSKAMFTVARDSFNDVIATSTVLIALGAETFFSVKIDGIMGLAVSAFIVFSGIKMAKETVSPLIGEGPDKELSKSILSFVKKYSSVIDCHDLMVHDYGPGRRYASVHVEMDRNTDVLKSHENIDTIERECFSQLGVHLVIHLDPVTVDDPEIQRLKNTVNAMLTVRDERLKVHDFRLSEKDGVKTVDFDVILPEEGLEDSQSLNTAIEKALNQLDGNSYTVNITFDI